MIVHFNSLNLHQLLFDFVVQILDVMILRYLLNAGKTIQPVLCGNTSLTPMVELAPVSHGCTIIRQMSMGRRPTPSSKGTKMKRYNVPPHCIGLVKSSDSKHTGTCSSFQRASDRHMSRNLAKQKSLSYIIMRRKGIIQIYSLADIVCTSSPFIKDGDLEILLGFKLNIL